MTIFVNGKKIKEIFTNGQSVSAGYTNGSLFFSKRQGWELGPEITITITSANNNSISGTITLARYDYYEGGNITDRYYQVNNKELSRATDGIVELDLGIGASVVFGNAAANADYYVQADGKIRLSASEISSMFRLRKPGGVLALNSISVTSNYLEPIQDMNISLLGADLYITSGWAIASNRISRIKNNTASGTSLSSLSVPKEGTWPVYAIASSGTEVTMEGLTCSVGAHQTYGGQNMRHLGWVTVASGQITNVVSLASATGSSVTKSISGSTLTVNAGYLTDTDGCKVYMPTSTYSFADMVTAAADVTVEEKLTKAKDTINKSGGTASKPPAKGEITRMWPQVGSPWTEKIVTTTKRIKVEMRLSHTKGRVDQYQIQYYPNYNGQSYPAENPYYEYITVNAYGSTTSTVKTFYVPQRSTINSILMVAGTASSGTGTWVRKLTYWTVDQEASMIPGTTQTRTLYAKITRNQNNSNKSVAFQTSTGNSSPYVSYVSIGTITVTRNSNTGTIT